MAINLLLSLIVKSQGVLLVFLGFFFFWKPTDKVPFRVHLENFQYRSGNPYYCCTSDGVHFVNAGGQPKKQLQLLLTSLAEKMPEMQRNPYSRVRISNSRMKMKNARRIKFVICQNLHLQSSTTIFNTLSGC